ncbi:hypothetical protein C8J57DRAFT_1249019 [Mycena rebaudengoi]|nr:hypothetical protein C8J57DRAFT_1249019 [Mycena rebaudengoi]
MHPSLRVENLSKIPSPLLRRLAVKALDGDLEVLRQLCTKVVPPFGAHATQFLPVLYAVLDPARIPTTDDMDAEPHSLSTTQTLGAIRWTMCTLHNLKPDIPRALCAWSEFALIGKLYVDDDAARLIDDTRGVRRLVARSWKVTLELRAEDDFNAAFMDLAAFISGGNIQGGIVLCGRAFGRARRRCWRKSGRFGAAGDSAFGAFPPIGRGAAPQNDADHGDLLLMEQVFKIFYPTIGTLEENGDGRLDAPPLLCTAEELDRYASEFAAAIPNEMSSIAQAQGFTV